MNNEEKEMEKYIEVNEDGSFRLISEQFEVQGAGEIEISKSPFSKTGTAVGFSFGVSWGRHGFCGGVLGRDEARRLANFILETVNAVPESEQDEMERRKREMQERIILGLW